MSKKTVETNEDTGVNMLPPKFIKIGNEKYNPLHIMRINCENRFCKFKLNETWFQVDKYKEPEAYEQCKTAYDKL